MIKFIVQYLDEISGEWIDSRTAFTLEEAKTKENEIKSLGYKTKIRDLEDERRIKDKTESNI